MAKIRSGDTKPELIVRRLLHGLGYRYRLHGKELPGKPDLVFSKRRKVIFVHGCFWHQHNATACLDGRKPKSNTAYWHPKLARNVKRDRENLEKVAAAGWESLVLWECELRDQVALSARLQSFLGPTRHVGTSRNSTKVSRSRGFLR
ncbi:very short patch repair endonuclease [Sphingomonas xanthus]|nr:DNA mismatch endonuclease Vsr [Sphingomonas xanthus]